MAATIRPIDAGAFALPAAAWLGWRAARDRRQVGALLASGVGVLLPVAAVLAVNAAWTGDPFRFGYITLWGKSHELGFHEAPWGFAHTPLRGLELVNLYLLRLQTYFLETPAPALLFATAALALARRLESFDRWALAGSALLLLGYFAYWHDGFYLGPRFMLPLVPWLAWWTARLPAVLAQRGVAEPVRRAVLIGGVIALLIAATPLVPIRWAQYRNGMLTMRLDPAAAAATAGVPAGATILVRESWGAQLMARMWGLGISRTDAERIYRTTDACGLDEVLTAAEREGLPTATILERLAPLRADSSRLRAQRASPDTTLRVLPGATWGPRCVRRLIEDRGGTSLFAPAILADTTSYRFRRDLHAADAALLADGRPLWLQTQAVAPGSPLRFSPVDPDSSRREWQLQ